MAIATEYFRDYMTEDTGTAYTDLLAVGANPTAKIYEDGTIVGSTDNGKYIRWNNGEMVCTYEETAIQTTTAALGSLYYVIPANMTFPVPFISKPVANSTPLSDSSSIIFGSGIFSITTTTIRVAVFSTSATATFTRSYIAKGRWKA